jgi:hypothetical protein
MTEVPKIQLSNFLDLEDKSSVQEITTKIKFDQESF